LSIDFSETRLIEIVEGVCKKTDSQVNI